MEAIVSTKDVWKVFQMNGVSVEAVRGIDLTVEPGEFVAIVGPSGSGKSSLLHLLGAMDRPTRGEVFFGGQALSELGDSQRADLRLRRLGFVFQTFNLLPTLTAAGNVDVAMRLAGVGRTERKARTTELLERVGLGDRAGHLPRQLSGGEQQRVAIARALANKPSLLLADEPTGNLDTKTGAGVLELVRGLCDKDGQTVIMVTHDFRAASYADRVLLLRDGAVRGETRLEGERDTRETLSRLLAAEL
ncbi:MAG: ABC transporter ATP-binding protein [Anaerolineales bacterium]|nr:MAG: ABC transporter ATP-binding protein [Anaerolineales bacterium]